MNALIIVVMVIFLVLKVVLELVPLIFAVAVLKAVDEFVTRGRWQRGEFAPKKPSLSSRLKKAWAAFSTL